MLYLLAAIFFLSFCLTGYIRRYALKKSILDIPNHRSSHVIPTPRGGGVSFVLCFLMVIPFLAWGGFLKISLALALIIAGLLIAVLGFWDDRKAIPAKVRLLGHFIASILVIICLGSFPLFSIYSWTLHPGFIASVVAVFYLVWLLNLYNFMDGIDGIASLEAITVCLGGAYLYYLSGNTGEAFLPLILAAAVGGFLCWNFPPARIFMGDAGSGFLGIIIGILALHAASIKSEFFWSWLILLGVFIVDATLTLVRRMIGRQKIYEAHCSHAYQHASRFMGSHLLVTTAVFLINCLWLLPLAILVANHSIEGFLGLLIAYLPLACLALLCNAGKITKPRIVQNL